MFVFKSEDKTAVYVSKSDHNDPLSSYSQYAFNLEGVVWPTVEHYYQAMRFRSPGLQKLIQSASNPRAARWLAKKNFWRMRIDWKKVRETYMTRAVYTKCLSNSEVANALLETGDKKIIETSQYDYYWGRGRDGRGQNKYGAVLMNVRLQLLKRK